MYLIQVGRYHINLDYLISDKCYDERFAPSEPEIPIGGILVTLERGERLVLSGPDADLYRRHVNSVSSPDPGDEQPYGHGKHVDPRTDDPPAPPHLVDPDAIAESNEPDPLPPPGPVKRRKRGG